MKKNLYALLALVIAPILFVIVVFYEILSVLQFLICNIKLYIEKFMKWIDKNITQNIKSVD